MKMLKYIIPFTLSVIVFSIIGFTPTDCIPHRGVESCILPSALDDEEINFDDCTFKGFPLKGKVKFVENFPDIRIQIVENFPDLKVKMVEHFPDDCGEWKTVGDFPDVKVQIVENYPDIKVKFVNDFPGKP